MGTDLGCSCIAAARVARTHATAQQKLMWEALREAVDEEMEADPRVCMMGAMSLHQHERAAYLPTRTALLLHVRTPVYNFKHAT